MPPSLSALVPNADDLLALEVEEVAAVLLVHLNSYPAQNAGSSVFYQNRFHRYNFFNDLHHQPQYPGRQDEVNRVLMEAWSWLQSEGFLFRDASSSQSDQFYLSRRAQRLRSREDFEAYRKATLLPKGQLHPLIAAKVYPAFLRGEYDTAVFDVLVTSVQN